MRRYWCSRWRWKSLRYLQKTEVLALLQFGERSFSLKVNLSFCECLCEGSLLCVSGCLKQMHSHSCYKYSSRMDACKDGVALNRWSHFPHSSIVTSVTCYWKGKRRPRRISLRRLSSIINVTSDRHLSLVSTGLNVWIRQSNQEHKRPHFFILNFIVLDVRISWAVQPCPCSNVLIDVRYTLSPRKMSLRIGLSFPKCSPVFRRRARWLIGPIKPCLLYCGRGWRRQVAWMGKGSSCRWWMVSEMVLTACVMQHLEIYRCPAGEGPSTVSAVCVKTREEKVGIGWMTCQVRRGMLLNVEIQVQRKAKQ